jgi:hypothetical protein
VRLVAWASSELGLRKSLKLSVHSGSDKFSFYEEHPQGGRRPPSQDRRHEAAAIRHVESDPRFNRHMRQLVHVAFRYAAKMGSRYLEELAKHEASVSRNVAANLWERHMAPLFLG